mgnify:CR=1 FL=1
MFLTLPIFAECRFEPENFKVMAANDIFIGLAEIHQLYLGLPDGTTAAWEDVPTDLLAAAAATATDPAVLGPAEDGGWWVLALRDPDEARALGGVEMSTPRTHDDTHRALVGAGLTVGATSTLRDVDTVADADLVAAAAPGSHFARAWAGPAGPGDPR